MINLQVEFYFKHDLLKQITCTDASKYSTVQHKANVSTDYHIQQCPLSVQCHEKFRQRCYSSLTLCIAYAVSLFFNRTLFSVLICY